jgi:hypothetical protein
MGKEVLGKRPDGYGARAAAALAVGLALGWTGAGDAVDRPPGVDRQVDARERVAELEKTFWQCEQAAGAKTLDAVMAAHCDAVTDELKKRKFGGDFERLLQWWQQNRLARDPSVATDPGEG